MNQVNMKHEILYIARNINNKAIASFVWVEDKNEGFMWDMLNATTVVRFNSLLDIKAAIAVAQATEDRLNR